MIWTIQFDAAIEKDFKKLNPSAQKDILRYLSSRVGKTHNPRDFGKPLRGNLLGLWRYPVGNYRIICRILDDELVVLAVAVGHRKDIYR